MGKCFALAAIVVAAASFAPAVARADANSDEARVHAEKALSAYALEHFAEAADEYEKAFALKSDPALLYNAAQAHRFAGNYERALHLYQSYLRIFGKKVPNRAEVDRHIRELEAAVATQKRAQQSPPAGVAETSLPPGEHAPEPQSENTNANPKANANENANANTKPNTDENVNVNPAPAPSVVAQTNTPPEKKPLVKRGWFWGVVVGAVVVVGVGVGLGVGLSSSSPRNPTGSFGATTVQ
jgi:tetratricopeptide (TPR) repeat protein